MSDPNHPIFPQHLSLAPGVSHTIGGLTKRELVAIKAMQGLIGCGMESEQAAVVAKSALRFADALLAELAKEEC